MKYVLIFIVQTIIVVFLLTPYFIVRFIWTFKWNNEIDTSMGKVNSYRVYKKSYRSMVNNIRGKK
jgi:hypothetical protein